MTEEYSLSETQASILVSLKDRFQFQSEEFRGDVSLVISAEQIVEVCKTLRDEFDFEMLVEETAVDYWPEQTPRFHIVYGLRL